jgi:hypothetical protein
VTVAPGETLRHKNPDFNPTTTVIPRPAIQPNLPDRAFA